MGQIDKYINKIIQGDCLEVMKEFPDDSVDLVITSPPYNLQDNIRRKKYDIISDKMDIYKYFNWIVEIIKELKRITKYHIFFNIQEVLGNKGIIKELYRNFYFKEVIIWIKTNSPCPIVDTQLASAFEYIFCISKDLPDKRMFKHCKFSQRKGDYIKNIFISPVNRNEYGHRFAFPIELPNFIINNFSYENDLILDCFAGSGTTLVSCKQLNRRYIGIEISEKYVEICKQRLSQEVIWQELK